jgi:hypothetical protein
VQSALDRSRGSGAVRYLAGRMALARTQAVSRSATVALVFEQDARGIRFSIVQDGDRDGVGSADMAAQVDRVVEPPTLLADLFPGASIGLTPQSPATQPVQVGSTPILSFTPSGTATSGSVYVAGPDGTQWAVRVLGVTARVRVLRWDGRAAQWVNAD